MKHSERIKRCERECAKLSEQCADRLRRRDVYSAALDAARDQASLRRAEAQRLLALAAVGDDADAKASSVANAEADRLEARLAGIEELLRELARQRQPLFAPQQAADAPLETMRLELPFADRPTAYETMPLEAEPGGIQWYDRVPSEVEAWIRPPLRPSPRYHWNTFPAPPYPSGP